MIKDKKKKNARTLSTNRANANNDKHIFIASWTKRVYVCCVFNPNGCVNFTFPNNTQLN